MRISMPDTDAAGGEVELSDEAVELRCGKRHAGLLGMCCPAVNALRETATSPRAMRHPRTRGGTAEHAGDADRPGKGTSREE
jgi:hypothetical protein